MFEMDLHRAMTIDVTYDVDLRDRYAPVEVLAVEWRGIDIMHALTEAEMERIFEAAQQDYYDNQASANDDRYDRMREEGY